jgi:hypothetical protein
MPTQTREIFDILSPLLKIWKYTALPNYKLYVTLNLSRFKCEESRMWWLIIFIVSILTVFNIVFVKTKKGVENYIEIFQICFSSLQALGILFLSHKRKYQFANIMSDYLVIETRLRKLTKNRFLYFQFKRKLFMFILVKFLVIFITGILDFSDSKPDLYVPLVVTYVCWIYDCQTEMFLICLLTILEKSYSQLETFVKKTRNGEVMLQNASKILEQLHDTSINLNKAFGGLILLKFCSDFIFTTHALFGVLSFVMHNNLTLSTVGTDFFWVSLVLLYDVYIIHSFSDIQKKVSSI